MLTNVAGRSLGCWAQCGVCLRPLLLSPQGLGATGAQEEGGGKLPSAAIAVTSAWALQGEALVDTSHGGELNFSLAQELCCCPFCVVFIFVWSISVCFRHLVTLLQEGFSFSEAHKSPTLALSEAAGRIKGWCLNLSNLQTAGYLLPSHRLCSPSAAAFLSHVNLRAL